MTTSQFINQNLNGMSLYRLAQLTGIGRSSVGKICRGIQEPSIVNFKAICKALNVSDSELINFIKQ